MAEINGSFINVEAQIDVNKVIAEIVGLFGKDIWNFVTSKYKEIKARNEVEYLSAYEEYLSRATDKYAQVKTLLFDKQPQLLYSFYECVGLRLRAKNVKIIDTNDIRNLVKIGRKLIITGIGGIGKTTMLRHFFLNSIKTKIAIPIFVELRSINRNESIIDCMYRNMQNLGFSLDKKYFEIGLSAGNHIILFDGFDEISTTLSKKVAQEIKQLSDKYNNNYYVISSRPSDGFIGWQQFVELEALPLNLNQAVSMIRKPTYNPEVQTRFAKELQKKLYKSHTSFASNPLLLTIMLLTYEDNASIPNQLHTFYEQAFVVLFFRHDATKDGFIRKKQSNLEYEEFKKLLSKFCFKTFFRAQYQFSVSRLNEVIDESKGQNCESMSCSAFIDDLVNATCILVKDGQSFTFTHRSFQEYFAALYVMKLSDDEQKELLCKWIKNRNCEFDSGILKILHDMEERRFNRNVHIPLLEELKEEYNNSRDKFEWAFEKLYSSFIVYDQLEDEEACYDLEILEYNLALGCLNNDRYVGPLIDSIISLYAVNEDAIPIASRPSIERYVTGHFEVDDVLSLKEVKNLDIFPDIVIAYFWIESRFISAFKLLEILKKDLKMKYSKSFDDLVSTL